jgi:ABC-type glycerol-3-phosphate transport system substrate-binding protein
LVIPTSSTNPEAAKAFVDFMTDKESQKYMLLEEPGNVVVPPDVFDIPEVMEVVPFAQVIREMVAASRSEYHPKSGEVVTIMVEEIQSAVAGEKDVESALADAEARVNALMP